MKLLSRITALTVLASPVLLGQPAGRERAALPEFPFRRPVSPEALGAKGVLRFSISRDSLRSFTGSAGSSELDYDLLRRFASDLNAGLEARVLDTPLDAARQLEAGMVDVAVLPADFETREGLVSTDPCPEPVARQTEPVRVAAFLRSDSRFLAELLSSASRRIADAGLSESIPPLYCSPSRFDEKPVEPELPKSRRISRYAPTIAKYAGAA